MQKHASLNERMARLEKQNRYMKVLLSGLLIVAGCVALMGAAADTTITASKIIIPASDGSGSIWTTHKLTFQAESGETLAELYQDRHEKSGLKDKSLVLYDRFGKPGVRLYGALGNSVSVRRVEGASGGGASLSSSGLTVRGPVRTDGGFETACSLYYHWKQDVSGMRFWDAPARGGVHLSLAEGKVKLELKNADGRESIITP